MVRSENSGDWEREKQRAHKENTQYRDSKDWKGPPRGERRRKENDWRRRESVEGESA
jgi:hypothetical protein